MVAQSIGLIDSDPIDDVAAQSGDDVEEVIDHLGIWAMLPHLQIERRIHVHRDSFSCRQRSGPATRRRADRFAAVAFAGPQDASIRVHHHGGVAVPLVQRKLVHHQATDAVGDELAVQSLQTVVVDLLDRMPVQARQLGNMGNRFRVGLALQPRRAVVALLEIGCPSQAMCSTTRAPQW